MKLPRITQAMISRFASAQSYERGEDYYHSGSVGSLVWRDGLLQARVQGSEWEPYQVQVVFTETEIADADCSCPYDWGGWCKHIVAVLLACLHEPEEIEERPPIESLLPRFDRQQLEETVIEWADRHPDFTEFLEARAPAKETEAAGAAGETPSGERKPARAVSADTYARKVSGIVHSLDRLRSSEAYWQVGGVVGEVRGVLDQARAFLDADQAENALAVLEGMTEAWVEEWIVLDDSDGYAGEFFEELGQVWTEAVLMADLSSREREALAKRLERWARKVADYGVEEAFEASAEAARSGWDYPPLVRVLQGEITDKGAWEGEAPDCADELAMARLKVLARRKRYQEYLHLAEAEGQTRLYLVMLAQLGRTEQAVEEGLQYLATTDEALALAQTLEEQGAGRQALRIAQHGLGLTGPHRALNVWLRDAAARQGEAELALPAATRVFQEAPDLQAYERVRELAGDRWPEVREVLLKMVRRAARGHGNAGPIEILLHEGLLAEALDAAGKGAHYAIVEQVADVAMGRFPERVAALCRAQAEPIVEEGRSQLYHHAARWLAKAKEAYQLAGKEDEWQAYLHELMGRHRRKSSLMPRLRALED